MDERKPRHGLTISRVLKVLVVGALLPVVYSRGSGPTYPHTQGEVWPKPRFQNSTTTVLKVQSPKLKYIVTGFDCEKIQLAIRRSKDYISKLERITRTYGKSSKYEPLYANFPHYSRIKEIQINLSQSCDNYPYFEMDESYDLVVAPKSELKSFTVWGIIRGMETFTQLFYLTKNFTMVLINVTDIVDYPYYMHRGLMVDTGRHYMPVSDILKNLDAMAMNKMNILHWHIVDDESFPLESSTFPELSKGAYHSSMVYTKNDMVKIRDYARDLGIRVIIELDMPGHAASWGVSHPEIFAKCKSNNTDLSTPLHFLKNETHNIIRGLLNEMSDLFPDNCFHFGGDEVQKSCWADDWKIKKYMKDNEMFEVNDLLAKFFYEVFEFARNDTIPIVWDDVFLTDAQLPEKTIVQTTHRNDHDHTMIGKILKAGYRVIESIEVNEGSEISSLFKSEPRSEALRQLGESSSAALASALAGSVEGGEACVRGGRAWPHAAAVAEVLWTDTRHTQHSGHPAPYADATLYSRLNEHICRMRRRGIDADPLAGPSFCLV